VESAVLERAALSVLAGWLLRPAAFGVAFSALAGRVPVVLEAMTKRESPSA
jgi:hypothetical protein